MDFDWKALVRTIAPALGMAMGGPLGGAAVNALTTAVLGPNAAPNEEELAKALERATPELLLKVKQADQEFALALRKLDVDLARADNEDRASARAREMALRDFAPSTLALLFVSGFFWIQYFVFNNPLPHGSETVIARVLGTMDAAVIMVLSYYFGSSRGSDRKTEIMVHGKRGNKQDAAAAPPGKPA